MKKITMKQLFKLADNRKSVLWVSLGRRFPAAFFQNWNARQLENWLRQGWLQY